MTRSTRNAWSYCQRVVPVVFVALSLIFSSACKSLEVPGVACVVFGVPNTSCTFTIENEDGSVTMTTIRFDGDGNAIIPTCEGLSQSCSPSSAAGG